MNIQITKKNLIVLAIFISLFVIIVIIAIINGLQSNKEEVSTAQLIQNTPLSVSNKPVTFQGEISLDSNQNLKHVYSYEIDDTDVYMKAMKFVDKSGKNYVTDTSHYEMTVWGNYTADHMKVDDLTGKLSFYFEYGPAISAITGDKVIDYNDQFLSLLKMLNGNDDEYQISNYKTTKEGIRIEAYRYVDGFPIETGANAQYTDYIEVTSEGRLIRGSINLLEYKQLDEVELIETYDIDSIFSSSAGSYEYQEMIPVSYYDIDTSDKTIVPENSGLPAKIEDDASADFNGSLTSGCVAQSASIAYFYRSLSQGYLTPDYKIKCLGSTYKNGKPFEIPVMIYVDAMKK